MADKSKIEWTDATWNPIRGCSRVSPGCVNCYAERVAVRFNKPGQAFDGLAKIVNNHPAWTGEVKFVEKHLRDPLHWSKPRRIFVNSVSDLFHEKIPFEVIAKIFAVMALAHWHTFQVLTKRPERALEFFKWIPTQWAQLWPQGGHPSEIIDSNVVLQFVRDEELGYQVSSETDAPLWPLPNVWLGVSVESQKYADERIPLLIQTPAAVRWLSIEPLLGPVSLRWMAVFHENAPYTAQKPRETSDTTDHLDGLRRLDWVVVGGESGPGARPMHPEWARMLRDQCTEAKVPFFFKQWGAWQNGSTNQPHPSKPNVIVLHDGKVLTFEEGTKPKNRYVGDGACVMANVGKKAAGRLLDGREYNGYPA
jgi:protein gp37